MGYNWGRALGSAWNQIGSVSGKWFLIGLMALMGSSAASAADLQITSFDVAPDPIAASATGTFTVVAENNSGQVVNDAVVSIAIPANYELVDAPGNFPSFCAVSGPVGNQTLDCTITQIVRGNPETITFDAIAIASGVENATANISAVGNVDNNAGNDSLTISTTVRNGADLSITKAGSAPSVVAGGSLTYTLTVTNDGPDTTSAVQVVDTLPAASDFNFQSATGSGWNCNRSGQTVTCNYTGAPPAVGAPYPDISIVGQVTSQTAGTISNIASVSLTDPFTLDPDGTNDTSNQVVTNVDAGSDIEAQKSMPSTIITGETVNITLTINNRGPQAVPAGATIVDTIDSRLTIGTLPAGCSASGQTVTCTAGAISRTGQATFQIPVTANAATGGTINNSATVAPPAGFPDPNPSNTTDTVSFEIEDPNADLQLRAKSKFPNPVAPGQNVTSRIFVRNLGPSVASYSPANPLRITDTLGSNETFVPGSESSNFSCSVAGNVVTCETTGTGTLAVGSDIRLDLTTIAGAGTDTGITNEACTDSTAGSAHTPSAASPSGNDCRSRTVRATTSAADLSVEKDVSLSPTRGFTENLTIGDGDNVFYIRLRATNNSGDLARSVRVRDTLPNFITESGYVTGVTEESATKGSLSYTSSNGRADWNFTNLAVGETETLVIRVERPFESGSFTNSATIFSSDTTETNNANNTDTAQYTAVPIADMTVNSKSVTPNPVRVGVPATYLISVRNDGANPADNVVLTDVIDPAFFEILGTPTTTAPGGSCSVASGTGTVSCSLGQFNRTEVRQVTVQVMPQFPFGPTGLGGFPVDYTNRATVETDTFDSDGGTDPNAGNNFFDLTHPVEAPEFDLAVTKAETNPATDDPIRFDETLNYDIRASNFGPSRATDVLVLDIPAPPAGLTMTLASVAINPVGANGGLSLQAAPNANCVTAGANVECRVDAGNPANNFLEAGNQVIFRLSFTIGGTAPSTVTTFANEVQITSAEQPVWNGVGADGLTSNNQAIQTTTVLPSTDLEVLSKVRIGDLTRDVNEPIEYVITFRNNGPSTATSVQITDVLPAGFVYVPANAPSTTIPGGSSASVGTLSCSGTGTILCEVEGTFPPGASNTVELSVFARANVPFAGPFAPTNLTNTVTITPGVDEFGDPLSEDAVDTNNEGTAETQILTSSIAGTSFADDNDNGTIEAGEGLNNVTVTLTGTDEFGNTISLTTTTDTNGNYSFDNLPPSDATGYTIVETQPSGTYDLAETAGSLGGTVDNSSFGDTAATNTIAAIVLPASTDATDYIFQNHTDAVITADDDNPAAVFDATGGDDIINALTNDTFNGGPATVDNIDITIVNPATPIGGGTVPVLDPATGLVDVAPGTPTGTYMIDYLICDEADPGNCAPATVTVIVNTSPIASTDDSESGVNGVMGETNVLNVLTGDTLNGNPATTSNVDIDLPPGSVVPSELTFDPSTGNVSVNPGTPAGSYSFDYRICDQTNATLCSISTVTVTVDGVPITAADVSETGINGATGAMDVLNVLTGDMLDGNPATTSNVTIDLPPGSTVPSELTFDPLTGNLSVNPGTPAGMYSFDYRICDIINPDNCAIATATVTVDVNPIEALPDTTTPIVGATGATGVIDVLGNDTLTLVPALLSTVDITVDAPATPINGGPVPVLDPATGLVDVPAGTPAGDYTILYTICEQANPTNCSDTVVTVPVIASTIEAVNDAEFDINGADGAADVLNVLTGDTVNGVDATTDNVTITLATGETVPAGLTFDPATGNVSVLEGTPAGEYSFDYQICETLNPDNCTIATATVTVIAAVIEAVDDTAPEVNSADGGTNVVNAFTADTLNGQPATPSNTTVALAPGETLPAGITFDLATGNVSVAPGTPDANYSFDYILCERLNPDNCSIATITVPVVPPRSTLSGIVFLDENLSDTFENSEELLESWVVEVSRNGAVVATTQTDADGFYSVEELLSGDGYEIRFLHPTTGVEFGTIEDADLPINGALENQDLPIDPSGVVYDAITRAPVPGAIVNLTDANGTPLPAICFLDPSQSGQITGADGFYRFDIVAGAAAQCPVGRTEYNLQVTAPSGFADPESTVIAAEDGVLNVAGLTDPAAIVPNVNAPQVGEPTTYYLGFLIGAGDANVVNNHIPLDPFLTRSELLITKTSNLRTASRGDLVPYTITVRNTEGATRTSVDVVDILPPGFKYVPGSAVVNNVASEPVVANRELRWEDQTLPGNSASVYQIIAVIGAGVSDGDRINTAVVRNGLNDMDISNRAQAVISIVPSAIFDCAEIIGKVFDDLDGDGYQDPGEPGIPGARVATVNGQLITTDEYGRYHITCAAVPNAQIGSNFVLKLDPRTIPEGYWPTSDNPQSIRLTRGKISELNFGVQRARVVSIELDQTAFATGTAQLKQGYAAQLTQLTKLEAQRLVLQVTYAIGQSESEAEVRNRLADLRSSLRQLFDDDDDWEGPDPTIETNITRPTAAQGGE